MDLYFRAGVFASSFESEMMLGFLQFGNEIEILECPIHEMSVQDYLRQWHLALKIICDGAVKSAIIEDASSIVDHTQYWPIYRINDEVIFQQRIGPEIWSGDFEKFTALMPDWSDTGASEWRVRVEDVTRFLDI
jgi:hypothetical protein